VAAFGNPDSYLIALHEQFEFAKSESGGSFERGAAQFRALGRGQGLLREATGFASLQLSPN